VILVVRKALYFILGLIALVLGSVMCAIAAYQLVTLRYYDRLFMMGLFILIAVRGFQGIRKAMHLSEDSTDPRDVTPTV